MYSWTTRCHRFECGQTNGLLILLTRPLQTNFSGFNFWRVSNNLFVQKILMRCGAIASSNWRGVSAYPDMVITPCPHPLFNQNNSRTCLTSSRLFRFDCLASCFFIRNRSAYRTCSHISQHNAGVLQFLHMSYNNDCNSKTATYPQNLYSGGLIARKSSTYATSLSLTVLCEAKLNRFWPN